VVVAMVRACGDARRRSAELDRAGDLPQGCGSL